MGSLAQFDDNPGAEGNPVPRPLIVGLLLLALLGGGGRVGARDAAAPEGATARLGNDAKRDRAHDAGGHHVVRRHDLVTGQIDQKLVGRRRGATEQGRRKIICDGESGVSMWVGNIAGNIADTVLSCGT